MAIPEYTNRVIADAARSQTVNIQEPVAFSNAVKNAQQQGAKLRSSMGELANVYLEMKQERDEGIVNQFMNEFDMAKTVKVQELKEQYNGGNAEGIIAAYNDWQRDYLNSRKGRREDSKDDTLYLENDEQIAMVDKAFGQDLTKNFNTMSAYVAGELKSYRNKQYAARDEILMDELAGEVDLNNMAITENMLRDNLVRRYPNQSKEFYDVQMKKKMQAALSANVNNDLLTQPEYALEKLNTPYIKDKLGDDANKLILKAGKAYIDREVDRISSERSQGNDVPVEIVNRDSDAFKQYQDIVGKSNIDNYLLSKVNQQTTIKKNNLEKQTIELQRKALVNYLQNIENSPIAKYIKASTINVGENEKLVAEAKSKQYGDDIKQINSLRDTIASYVAQNSDEGYQLSLKNSHDIAPDFTQFITDVYTKAKVLDAVKGKINIYTNAARQELEQLPDNDIRKQEYLEMINTPEYGEFVKASQELESASRVLQDIDSDKYDTPNMLMNDIKDMSPLNARELLEAWKTNQAWKQFTQYALADKRVPDNIDAIMTRTLNKGETYQLSRNTFIRSAMQEQSKYDILKYIQGHPDEIMSKQTLAQILESSKQTMMSENKELIELSGMLKDVRSKISRRKGKEASLNPNIVAGELLKRLEGNEEFAELDEKELTQMATYLINNEPIMAQYLWKTK